MDLYELTPIEYHNGIAVKRDDLFNVCGVSGGKARSAYQLITQFVEYGCKEVTTTGSKDSPQCEIVASICRDLGLKCTLFFPNGKYSAVMEHCAEMGANIVQNKKWLYQNVLIYHTKEYCCNNDACGYVPFGMECGENVMVTKHQVRNIPENVKRIVMPIGSGMSFSSVAQGLDLYEINIPILGVQVGKDPKSVLKKYYPFFNFSKHKIIKSDLNYSDYCYDKLGDLELDPIYEAKCAKYLENGDLLWIVGKRL